MMDELPYETKYFCIIASEKNYSSALAVAKAAQKQMKLKIDLGGLTPNKITGLTITKAECENNGWEYPAYVRRGRYDDGAFISIEYSNSFKGFAKGFYMVFAAASGDKLIANKTLAKAKPFIKLLT